ncbi:glycoside hydrolase family 127 protein [Acidicapsa acidisoli]|uniref:glycoside hydrolase family 127 protein n=1 Tax=Acidicapsa acidisoli TaxID=1615681 RepID=UPI0021E0DA30|nr:beta-L-arabinofuranosidase domain-containing protein [Acidicapsa acidisoli]
MTALPSMNRRTFLNASIAAAASSLLPRMYGETNSSTLEEAASGSHLTPNWKDEGVLDLTNSPHAKLKTVPIRAVVIEQGFWSPRRATNVTASIPSMREELLEHGRMDNFLRLENRSTAQQRGPVYSDSDIYKWAEAVGFALQSEPLPELRRTTDEMIQTVVAAQEKSGYLNTYYVQDRAAQRMLPHTQEMGHELYNIGHLLQGAIAYYRATGDPTLLNAGMRFIDGYLLPDYGPGTNQKPIVAGHPEIEMSLIELYRTTGNRRYLELAGYILHGDDRLNLRPESITYMFCGIPFTSRTKLEGHAVRAMYACCGATDYYLETGDPAYWQTLNHLWQDLSEHQMYITGGVGARSQGESFGHAFELPNAQAYGESCAAIGNMMWNWRMLAASGEARFADVIERALYNGINSGMSLDGKLYCYRNPLAHDSSTRDKIRNPWYDTTCCPPNLERTLASLPGYFYSTSEDGVYVHLYDNSEMNWHLHSGTSLHIKQETRYPWEGDVRLHVHLPAPEAFTLYVRIPAWSRTTTVTLNDKPVEGVKAGEYLPIHNHWSGHDHVEISFDMQPKLVHANPAVADDMGRVAIQRGPIVYCMEQLDQKAGSAPIEFYGYSAHLTGETTSSFEPNLLGGVVALEHPGSFAGAPATEALYSTGEPSAAKAEPATKLKLIPYYAWANREDSSMQVWIPYIRT